MSNTQLYFKGDWKTCGPNGTDCFKNFPLNTDCLEPCHGLYADIHRYEEGTKQMKDMKRLRTMLQEYEEYKRGYHKEVQFPVLLKSRAHHSLHTRALLVNISNMGIFTNRALQ